MCPKNNHRSHIFRVLESSFLLDMIHDRFGEDVMSFLTTRKNEIEESFTKISSEIGELTATLNINRNVVEDLEGKRAIVNLCLQRLNEDVDKENLDLLLTIYKMDLKSSAQSHALKCSAGAQREQNVFGDSLWRKIYQQFLYSIAIILPVFIMVFHFLRQIALSGQKNLGNFWSWFQSYWWSEIFSIKGHFLVQIKQRDPLTFIDVSLELFGCEIRLEPKITKKKGHEKMFSYWIDTQCPGNKQVENVCKKPLYIALINPHNRRQCIRKRIELEPSVRRYQLVEMIPYSDLITTYKHWERNGCFVGRLQCYI